MRENFVRMLELLEGKADGSKIVNVKEAELV